MNENNFSLDNQKNAQESSGARRKEYEKEFGKEIIGRFYEITPDEVIGQLEPITPDPTTGIKILSLKKAENPEQPELYAALIPEKVNPHVHMEGLELYRIISGKGIMNLQTVTPETFADENEPEFKPDRQVPLESGSIFEVEGRVAHSLKIEKTKDGKETEPLILIFVCPPSHMVNTGETDERGVRGDRTFFKKS